MSTMLTNYYHDLLNTYPQLPKYVDLSAHSVESRDNSGPTTLNVFDTFMEFVCYPPYLTYCVFCTSTW